MEYIVTGGTGFVGYVVVKELVNRGYSPIKVITRSQEHTKRFAGLDVNFAIGDVLDRDFIFKEITTNAVVFHLAGIVDISSHNSPLMDRVNIEGAKNVIAACIANQVKRLVYASSVAVIEPLADDVEMSEPLVIDVVKQTNQYAKTKAIATNYIFNQVAKGNLDAVVLYPSAIIGPYDYNISNVGQAVLDYMNHNIKAYIKGSYNFVDVRDVADGIINAYEQGETGEGYILSSEVITVKELFMILNEKLGRKRLPIKMPLWLVKMVVPIVELHYRIHKKKPIFSSCSIKTINQNCNFNNSKAIDVLGFNPRPLRESIYATVDWFNEYKEDLIKDKYRKK